MTDFNITPDEHGFPLYDKTFSDNGFEVVLPANAVKSVAVPSGMTKMWMSGTGDFYMAKETFLLPTSNDFVSSVSELNPPSPYTVDDTMTIFFRSTSSQQLTVGFYT